MGESKRAHRAFAAVFAALVSACGVAPLSTRGEIRCASDRPGGGCPRDYSCLFGRCCPNGSVVDGGAGACPAPADLPTDGSIQCLPGSEAQPGLCPATFTCRFGRCCPADDSGTGLCSRQRIGAPCTDNSSCTGGSATSDLRCYTREPDSILNAPGGVCVRNTACVPTEPNACGDGNVCIQGECYPRCTVPVGTNRVRCREGGAASSPMYSCRRISADSTTTEGFCFLDCGRMGENGAEICVASSTCDRATGLCGLPCMNRRDLDCPNAAFICNDDDRCVARYFACRDDNDCGAPDALGQRALVCRPHPRWSAAPARSKVCVINRPTCELGTPCAPPIVEDGLIIEFPCIQGACVVRVGSAE